MSGVAGVLGVLVPGSAARTVLQRNIRVARSAWLVYAAGIVEPLVYLLVVDAGLDPLIGGVTTSAGTVPYVAFVAPALLAAAGMNAAVAESTYTFWFKLKVDRVYTSVMATPAEPLDVVAGELAWTTLRGGGYAVTFLLAAAPYGVLRSWWALAAVPAAMLVTVAFAAVGVTLTTFMRTWQDFDWITLVVAPLFLLSATFYPLDVYPAWAQAVAVASPLYHATELMRACTLGALDATVPLHAAVLVAMAVVGLRVAPARLSRLLRA